MAQHRVLDWRTRLVSWAAAQIDRPFEWGSTDCASLARAALVQMFGEDVVPAVPTYATAREALRAWAAYGPVGFALEQIGASTTLLPFMRAGDIIVVHEEAEDVGQEAVLVCIDYGWCITSSVDGVIVATPEEPCTVYSLWEVVPHG